MNNLYPLHFLVIIAVSFIAAFLTTQYWRPAREKGLGVAESSYERGMRFKDLSRGKPPLTYSMTIGFSHHELALKGIYDVVLDEMEREGPIRRIVTQYLGDKSSMLFHQQPQYDPY